MAKRRKPARRPDTPLPRPSDAEVTPAKRRAHPLRSNASASVSVLEHVFAVAFGLSLVLAMIAKVAGTPGGGLEKVTLLVTLVAAVAGVAFVFRNRERCRAVAAPVISECCPDADAAVDNVAAPATEVNGTTANKAAGSGVGRRQWFALLCLLVVSTMVYGYRLGHFDFYMDEFQVVHASVGYHHTGKFYKWSFADDKLTDTEYDRAWPHTRIIAQSYKLFGISEWSSRLPSVVFGILLIAGGFAVGYRVSGSANVALLIAASLLFYPDFIELFRWTRMYAFLMPVFLLLSYVVFRLLSDPYEIRKESIPGVAWYNRNINYNPWYVLIVLPLLKFAREIHVNALAIAPVGVLYLMYLSVTGRARRHIIAVSIAVIGPVVVFILKPKVFHEITKRVSFFEVHNPEYLGFLLSYPFSTAIGITILLIGGAMIIVARNRALRDRLVFACILVGFILLFFGKLTHVASPRFRYTTHVTVIAIVAIVGVYCLILRLFSQRSVRIAFVCLLLGNLGVAYCSGIKSLYVRHPRYGSPSVAYKTLAERYDPQSDVVITGPYFRSYYYPNADKPIVKQYPLTNQDDLFTLVRYFKSGWIVWETGYSYLRPIELLRYIHKHFEKLHGTGVDDTRIEMYYFTIDMLPERDRRP